MKNSLLRKFIENLDALPREELIRLINSELDESELYIILLDSLKEAHIVVDENANVVYYNSALFSFFPKRKSKKGWNKEDTLSSLIADRDILRFIEEVKSGRRREENMDFTLDSRGINRTVRVSFSSIRANRGKLIDIEIKDITEEIKKEARLRRSESLASMTTMAAGIAHEIKNPLAAMKIHIQLLEKAFDEKKGDRAYFDKCIEVLEEETDRLNSIAVDFLYATRPMNIEMKLSDISDVLSSLFEFISPEAAERKVTLVLEDESFLPPLLIDKKMLYQAFLNIVENSFQAMKEGDKLTLSVKRDGDFVSLSFVDTGEGMDEETQLRIFEPYFTTKAKGTGLGLTTVWKIVKEHGGDITLKSKKGEGTEMRILLPIPTSSRKALGDK